jgi:hypothetical protein
MDISSVKKPAVQPTSAPKRTAEAHQTPVRESKPHESETRKVAQVTPKPIVNTQGQVTGRHLNVTA